MGLIKSSHTISLDSNIFIRAIDDPTILGEKARNLIDQIKEVSPTISISTMVLEEFFVRVYKEKRERHIEDYLNFISFGGICNIIDINQQISLLAAKLRAEHPSLRAPDAIHLASAIESGAKVFITTDRRFPKNVGKLEVKVL